MSLVRLLRVARAEIGPLSRRRRLVGNAMSSGRMRSERRVCIASRPVAQSSRHFWRPSLSATSGHSPRCRIEGERASQSRAPTMRQILASALLLLCGPAFAGEIGRPVGKNCDLAEPPDTAGEEFDHGALLRIYPRARDIGMSYNGCQAVWVQTMIAGPGPSL
jgi:hypothetical protein